MNQFFSFGEVRDAYEVPVLNEREVRAASGIMFLLAMVAFMNAWLVGNYAPLRVLVVVFFLDFFIRVLINPRFSPSLILGRLFTKKQRPEFTGAPQKRFAWALGLGLASFMVVRVVLLGLTGPINLIACLTCLVLLFFETAFGICVGCKIYNLFPGNQAKLCPGGVCEIQKQDPVQVVGMDQVLAAVLFFVALGLALRFDVLAPKQAPVESAEQCTVPEWVYEIGHEEQWKLHHECE